MGAEEFEVSHVASAAATVVPSAGIDVMKDAAKKHLQSVFEKLGGAPARLGGIAPAACRPGSASTKPSLAAQLER